MHPLRVITLLSNERGMNVVIRVSILGATGYTGGELLTWLARHPQATLVHATSSTRSHVPIAEVHPRLRGQVEGHLEAFDAAAVAADSDVVFSCLPHGQSQGAVAALYAENPSLHVVDLSGDFRFADATDYEAAYGVAHVAPQLAAQAAYGLPELHRHAIQVARLVANPGCYPTAALVPLAPFARLGLLSEDVVIDAKSGVSGAGATPTATTHYANANESVQAYNPLAHRHQPEIGDQLQSLGAMVDVDFVPHLVPMTRGLHATIYARLTKAMDAHQVYGVLAGAYANEPFVRILEAGRMPQTKDTLNSNFVDVGFALAPNGRRLVLASCLDNLVKGASGQAIQNMNILQGLPETTGLTSQLKTVVTPYARHA